MLRHNFFRSIWTAATWFLIITTLFFLPGSALPDEGALSLIYFDKWVHTGFFATLCFLWRSHFYNNNKATKPLMICLVIYAVLVEVVQKEWIPNRSFDVYDIAADMAGMLTGLVVWRQVYKKK